MTISEVSKRCNISPDTLEVLQKYSERFKRGKRTLNARRKLLATERKALQGRLGEL